LKPERWGSLLVQEKYQEEMPVTGDIHNNNNNNNNNKKNNDNIRFFKFKYVLMFIHYRRTVCIQERVLHWSVLNMVGLP